MTAESIAKSRATYIEAHEDYDLYHRFATDQMEEDEFLDFLCEDYYWEEWHQNENEDMHAYCARKAAALKAAMKDYERYAPLMGLPI